jgi:hypothetical protein
MIPRLFAVLCAITLRWTVSHLHTPDPFLSLKDTLNRRLPSMRQIESNGEVRLTFTEFCTAAKVRL